MLICTYDCMYLFASCHTYKDVFVCLYRSAIAKMENIQIAAKYLKEKEKWPMLKGHRICMKPDTRVKHKKTSCERTKNL